MNNVNAILQTVLLVGAILLAIAYAWSQYVTGGAKQLEEKNKQVDDANDRLTKTLNDLLATQNKKIEDLQKSHSENEKEIANLKGRVDELSKKNGDLQSIINTALDRYFSEHPEEALKLASIKAVRKGDLPL